jgi:hypothetical protein
MFVKSPFATLIVAFIVAVAGLYLYNPGYVDPAKVALGTANTESNESLRSQRITAVRLPDIIALTEHFSSSFSGKSAKSGKLMLWLGNSQLHTINQLQTGDHLAPYWLAQQMRCNDCVYPLGISLPNADIQEHYVLAHFIRKQLPLSLLVVGLCFDDLREDGLRDDFGQLMNAEMRADLHKTGIGQKIIHAWNATHAAEVKAVDNQETAGLQGFIQKHLEDALIAGLNKSIPLWAARPNIRVQLLTDLYYFRNWLFGIKPTTVRRIIATRYDNNMQALEALMREVRQAGIPMLVYIAPIRQDVSLPYDQSAYDEWKAKVAELAAQNNVSYLNLERLVPGKYWGSYHDEDIDFMHFQGHGHVLLASALLPHVQRLLMQEDR